MANAIISPQPTASDICSLHPAKEALTVRVVDRVLVVKADGSRVQLDRLLIVALLELFVAQVLEQNAS